MLEAPPDSLLRRTLVASCQLAAVDVAATPARQSWAAQFAAAMASVGQPVSLLEPAPVSLPQLLEAGQERQLTQLLAAAAVEGASKLQYYVRQVGGLGLVPAAMGRRQAYLEDARLRLRQRWEALAQLRTGSHWLAEETGRWLRPPQPREARICPHCRQGVEDAAHMVYDCPLYAPQRQRWHSLFPADEPRLLTVFLAHDPYPLADFVAACRKQWERANAALAAAP